MVGGLGAATRTHGAHGWRILRFHVELWGNYDKADEDTELNGCVQACYLLLALFKVRNQEAYKRWSRLRSERQKASR